MPPRIRTTWNFSYPAIDTYIDLDMKFFVPGKLVSDSGKDDDLNDTKVVANNLLHSLFNQCNFSLNGTAITQSKQH